MVAEAGGVVLITPLQGLRTENSVNVLDSGRLAWALLGRRVRAEGTTARATSTIFTPPGRTMPRWFNRNRSRVSRPQVRSRISVKAESSAGMAW